MNNQKKTLKKQNAPKSKEKNTNTVKLIDKDKKGKSFLTSFGKTVVICLSVILALVIALIISVNSLISYYYNLMNYTDISKETVMGDDEISDYLAELEGTGDVTGEENNEEMSEQLGGAIGEMENTKETISGIKNILLLGVDNAGKNSTGNATYDHNMNTDSMILLTINEKTKKIVLTSLMRDSYVEIIRANGSKINGRLNTAYIYGGYSGMFNTIEHNFGIKVDSFVSVDFSSFMDIVNIIGGVDMYVTRAEAIEMNYAIDLANELIGDKRGTDRIKITSDATLHLNGKQALAYARIRHNTGNDFGRTERQRKLIMEIANKARDLNVSQLNELLTTALKKVSTNLKQSEVTSLMANAVSYLGYEIVPFRIPMDETYRNVAINGASVLMVDFVKNYKTWKTIVTE